MPSTTTYDISKLKEEILNKLSYTLNSYDTKARVTEKTSNFTASGTTSVFLLSATKLVYVKTVTKNSVALVYGTDYSISFSESTIGSVILTVQPALNDVISIVWGENTSGKWIYSDFPRDDLNLESYPRVGFELTVTHKSAGTGGGQQYYLAHDVLIQIKIVDTNTYFIDKLSSAIQTFVKTNCKKFYYIRFIEPSSTSEYSNFDDNTKQTYSKFLEFKSNDKYEVVTFA